MDCERNAVARRRRGAGGDRPHRDRASRGVLAALRDTQGAGLSAGGVRARVLRGRFAVIGESILSVYACESSGYHGSEHLGQIDANTYRSAGVLLLKDQIIYSWQLMLQRAPQRA